MSMEYVGERQALSDPTPKQIFDIARLIIGLARKQNRFKTFSSKDMPLEGYRFFPDELTEATVNPFGEKKRQYQRYFGVIGKTGVRSWRMLMVEPYLVIDDGIPLAEIDLAKTDLMRTKYSFEWNHQAVTRAARKVRAHGDDDAPTYEEMVVLPEVEVYGADVFSAASSCEMMSSGDCSELARRIMQFRDLSEV